jgi:hypothetical protein
MTRCVAIGRVLAVACLVVISPAALARAEDPSGNWKWTMAGRGGGGGGGQTREVTAKLKLEGDKLTGTVAGRNGDTAIEEGTFKDDTVSFQVTRERNGQKTVTKYSGKLSGDTITGTVEFTGGQGGGMPRDWKAERIKS